MDPLDQIPALSRPGKTLKAWLNAYLKETGELSVTAMVIAAKKAGFSKATLTAEFGRRQVAFVRQQLRESDGHQLIWPERNNDHL